MIETLLARELGLNPEQVTRTVALLDAGNTIPFITRYRKEATGGLDERQLRRLEERLQYLRNLAARRDEIAALLEQGGHLTPQLRADLDAATTMQVLEDLYLPFRPKRRTRAQIAREHGLQPLADALLSGKVARTPDQAAAPFLNEQVPDTAAALAGARDIIAEEVAETAAVRQTLRDALRRSGVLRTARKAPEADPEGIYRMYYEFAERLATLPPHRIMAINRGEREEMLTVHLEADHAEQTAAIQRRYLRNIQGWAAAEVQAAIADGYRRLLLPAIERDLRNELTERAETHALGVFAANLRGLLLQPPLRGRIVLGIDPGFRTGCKLAVVDATGKYLEGDVLYLHQPERAREKLRALIQRHGVQIIAIGNGTASRETEALIADLTRASQVRYLIVSEAGASVYSASELAAAEFPNLDATQRGNISIARRVLDPLAELVKIDPKALGVGLYQHDLNQKRLGEQLGAVVESCVNYVGVDLNTASAALLTSVAGLNARTARSVVAHRDAHGPFRSRRELLAVSGLGPKAFEQAAGFLRIPEAADPLDNTAVHPESYPAARRILARFGAGTASLPETAARVQDALNARQPAPEALAEELGIGVPTLLDIVAALAKPGRDPRDDAPPPILRADVLTLDDLHPGLWLQGTVRNVVDFGAFVDIGLKQDGLVHVSEMADRFVRNPLEIVQVGDIVDVCVLSVDAARGRIALSMKRR